jgi:microcystin degradation protein MlrC
MTRIAIGGFLHETNTFASTKAARDDFFHGCAGRRWLWVPT